MLSEAACYLIMMKTINIFKFPDVIFMPNSHRQCQRDDTANFRCVGVVGVK